MNTSAVRPRSIPSPRRGGGFSLIELLVVMAILTVLASMLLPALARARSTTQGAQCGANSRLLAFSWLLYADDHDGRVVLNRSGREGGWVSGELDFESHNTDNTNSALLLEARHARLGPYQSSASIYKCPSDLSRIAYATGKRARVRSVAMNLAVGGDPTDESWRSRNAGWRTFGTVAQIQSPSPSALWVFVDEHPDSVDDGQYTTDLDRRGSQGYFYSWPANFHADGANLAFADGHVERHRWLDERTRHENKYCGCLSSYAHAGNFSLCPGNPDLAWMQERTSSPLRER